MTALAERWASDQLRLRPKRARKFNEHHDERGRFAEADGAASAVDDRSYSIVRAWQIDFENVRAIQEHPSSPEARLFADAVAACPAVEGVVYRGVNDIGSNGQLSDDQTQALWASRVGQTVVMHNPVSTTTDRVAAEKYGSTLLVISQNGAAHDIRSLSQYPNFKEAVLAPGRYRVDKVEKGRAREMTLFGPVLPRGYTTVVHLTDVTTSPRQWYSDRSGAGARRTTVGKAVIQL